ncbi:hypothetical protein ACWKSP_09130 [Micromonosporaceae bacterium Da 78-11]
MADLALRRVGRRLHVSRRAERFHLWRADGRLSSFPFATVTEADTGPLRLTTDLAEIGSAHASVLLKAMGPGQAEAGASLAEVIAALDLTDRYPYDTGTVTRRPTNVGTTHHPELIDFLVADHPLHLDLRTLHTARSLTRGQGASTT